MLKKTLLTDVNSLRLFIDFNRCKSVPDSGGSVSPSLTSSSDVLLSSGDLTAERRVFTSSSPTTPFSDGGPSCGVDNSTRCLRSPQNQSIVNVARYKTELCRQFEENGMCRYAEKCQFAHGRAEIRSLSRHPKYKTEMCRTFHTSGFCPYGLRCHFIHNDDERQLAISRHQSGSSTDVCPAHNCPVTLGVNRSATGSYQHVFEASSSRHQRGNCQHDSIRSFPMTTMSTALNFKPISTPEQFVMTECGQLRRGRPILARSDEDSTSEVLTGISMTSSFSSLKLVTEE